MEWCSCISYWLVFKMNNISGGFKPFIVPIVSFVLWIGIYASVLLFLYDGVTIESFKKQAVENNCAQYNPTNGNFEWIKNE